MSPRNKNILIAILFALIYPGLGHIYLRSWIRAITWFLFAIATTILVVPTPIMESIESGGVSVIFSDAAQLPFEAYIALAAVNLLNIVDVYLVAKSKYQSTESTSICTLCGRKLDPDLSFCPWCTADLE